MGDFLLEIGVEEIPDWMIEAALSEMRAKFQSEFSVFGMSSLVTDATPRRLVLVAKGLNEKAPDTETVVLGPYVSAGSKAAEGFARKWNSAIDQMARIADAKGERYVFHHRVAGESIEKALADKLPEFIAKISWPKAMTWPGSGNVRFIRPIRWIVALLDDRVVSFTVAGVLSGNETRGHRILGARDGLAVTLANYDTVLQANGVMYEAARRQEIISKGLGEGVERDDTLLATLVYLTEFPSVIRGTFDEKYLELPREILSTVMRHHQRYFSVANADGTLAPEFVAVTNTDGDPDGLIRRGNERVLRARFNDAKFFWQADQRKSLADRVADLEHVTFQAELGSYLAKSRRIVELAGQIAPESGANSESVTRAALLCKCDLTTDMVKEFTELQGIVGGLYAKAQGETETVASAIYDHYKPVGMEDSIPASAEGQTLALADKLDTLRECFRIGLIPTGSRDPFALRRAAQGFVKILFEAKLPVSLTKWVRDVPQLEAFLRDRIEFYLRDVLGYAYDEVGAVLATPLTTLPDIAERVGAIHAIRATPDFEPVAASFKRIQNILVKSDGRPAEIVDPKLFAPGPEEELYRAFEDLRPATAGAQYKEKLAAMASLRPHVDLFFDRILVNDPNSEIRRNRLALLSSLLAEFSNIADFSEIVTQGSASA